MSRHNYKKSKLKYVFLAFTCAATFAFSGIAAACGDQEPEPAENESTPAKEDTQLLKNGNFEFFTIPETQEGGNDPEYLIKSPTNWSHGGASSYTMSGIISTSKTAWAKMVADNLADNLDYNNKLDSSASNYLSEYIDYNGMKSTDILYKDQYEALKAEDDYKVGETIPENRKDRIDNPGTHYNVTEENGKVYAYVDGVKKEIYADENGEYFLEYDAEKDEYNKPISNILMLHNYATSHNGIAQNYSSVEVNLPANTAAEISVWVKTAYLKHNQGKEVDQDRGAYISVVQTVGDSTLDDFTISCINTEKLLGLRGYPESEKAIAEDKYNGWVQYTVYVNACDFAATGIEIKLGLGESDYATEGYAFFDDVTVTKYASLSKCESYKAADKDNLLDNTTCNISTDASEKIYKADSWVKNGGTISDARYSKNFHYLIDLASELPEGSDDYYRPIIFDVNDEGLGLKAGLTVDDDNYVSSKQFDGVSNITGLDYTNCLLPFTSDLKETGLITKSDYLAVVKAGHTFTSNETQYYEKLNGALSSAANLPKNSADNDNNMLVMLSAYGAAYTASFTLNVPRSGNEYDGYQIISFWVKTSDMDGSTAATVKITQADNDDNTASFTIDTKDIVTNIGDNDGEKDIYDGWVQCFLFVNNELEADDDNTADSFIVEFSFGNTIIKGTNVNAYKPGWVALANMQYLNVDEDIFAYTGSDSHTASLTISEEAEKYTQAFDSAYANESHEIKDNMVNASSYKGVNGGSSFIVNNGHVSIPFDESNNNVDDNGNKFAGLINKEYFENYEENRAELGWYDDLLDNFNASGLDALAAWNKIFGEKSYQPLVITNRTRTSYVEEIDANENNYKNYYIKNDDGEFELVKDLEEIPDFDKDETYYSRKDVMNYGYIGESKTVSTDSYSTISVRVKASAKAVAYVYLVDTSAGKNLLSFSAPTYSFYYDIEGNVLKGEPKADASVTEQRANILYYLRDDGLYEDKDGKLYANTWNYSKLYYLEDMTYYDKAGNQYSIEDLVDGVDYYDSANENTRKVANHYLVTTSGIKVYQYVDGNYHYIVDGKTQSEVINPFDKDNGHARYDFSGISEDYVVEIKGSEHPDEWVTVTFVLHAGSENKSYRLELWSGKRDETGLENEQYAQSAKDEMVLFDYSYTSISDDSLKSYYEQEIIDEYIKAFKTAGLFEKIKIETTGKNIAYFEKIAANNNIKVNPYNYKSHYYTFSLYDSADYQPFNKTTASDGATGYDYSVSDQTESLVYLKVQDNNAYTIFADYSAVDKSISLNNPSDTDKTEPDEDEDKGSDGSVWLLASSIILVIALIFAIIAIFLKDALKKARRNKVTSKNNYDQRKANRYKRKLHLKQETTEEVDAINEGATEDNVDSEENSEPIDIDVLINSHEAVESTTEEAIETPAPEEPSEDSGEASDGQPADGEEKSE